MRDIYYTLKVMVADTGCYVLLGSNINVVTIDGATRVMWYQSYVLPRAAVISGFINEDWNYSKATQSLSGESGIWT